MATFSNLTVALGINTSGIDRGIASVSKSFAKLGNQLKDISGDVKVGADTAGATKALTRTQQELGQVAKGANAKVGADASGATKAIASTTNGLQQVSRGATAAIRGDDSGAASAIGRTRGQLQSLATGTLVPIRGDDGSWAGAYGRVRGQLQSISTGVTSPIRGDDSSAAAAIGRTRGQLDSLATGVTIPIRVEGPDTARVEQSAKSGGERVGGTFGSGILSSAGGKMGTIGTVLFGGSVLKMGYDRLTTIEDATKSLTVTMGDAGRATQFVQQMLKVVEGTPFSLDQFAEAGKNMISFGVEAGKVPGIMTAIGNAAAASGKGAGMVDQLTDSFGKMAAQGQVSLDQVWAVSSTGVNALQILADGFGVSRDQMKDMISSGTVPATKAIDVLTKGINEGTKSTPAYAGQMKALGDTTSGTIANLKTAAARVGANILGPLMGPITRFADQLTKALDSAKPSLTAFGQVFADVLITALPMLIDGLKMFLGVMRPVMGFLKEHPNVAKFAVALGLVGFSAIKIAGPISQVGQAIQGLKTIGSGLGFLTNPWVLLAVAIVALGIAIYVCYRKFKPFRDVVDNIGRTIRDVAIKAFEGLKRAFDETRNVLSPLFEPLKKLGGAFFRYIKEPIETVIRVVKKLIKGDFTGAVRELAGLPGRMLSRLWDIIVIAFKDVLPALLEVIGKVLPQVLEAIPKALGGIGDLLGKIPIFGGFAKSVFKYLTEPFRTVAKAIGQLINGDVWGALRTILGLPIRLFGLLFNMMWQLGKLAIQGLIAGVKALWGLLTGFFGSMGSAIGEIAGDIFGWLWNLIKGLPAKIWEALKDFGSWIWNGITNGLATLAAGASVVWDAISGFFTSLPGRVWGAVQGLANIIAGPINTAKDWIWARVNDVVGFFIGLPGRIWNGLVNLANIIHGPIQTAKQWIGDRVNDVVNFFIGLPGRIWNAILRLAEIISGPVNTAKQWIADRVNNVVEFFAALPGRIWNGIQNLANIIHGPVQTAKNWISDRIGDVVGFFTGLPGKVRDALKTIGDAVQAPFKAAFNFIIKAWNNTLGKIKVKIPGWVPKWGGKEFGFPTIPEWQRGGIISRPTVGLIGEAGPELVLPLTDLARSTQLLQAAGVAAPMAAGGPIGTATPAVTPSAVAAPGEAAPAAEAAAVPDASAWTLATEAINAYLAALEAVTVATAAFYAAQTASLTAFVTAQQAMWAVLGAATAATAAAMTASIAANFGTLSVQSALTAAGMAATLQAIFAQMSAVLTATAANLSLVLRTSFANLAAVLGATTWQMATSLQANFSLMSSGLILTVTGLVNNLTLQLRTMAATFGLTATTMSMNLSTIFTNMTNNLMGIVNNWIARFREAMAALKDAGYQGGRQTGGALYNGLNEATPHVIRVTRGFAHDTVGAINPVLVGIGKGPGIKLPFGRAYGGPIPGAGNTDTVPAMLTPGEFVIRKDAAKRVGYANLHALNDPRGYQGGGIVAAEQQILKNNPGLRVTSGLRPGGKTYHGKGLARDFGGSVADMNRASAWILSSGLWRSLTEGIYAGQPALSVKNNAQVPPSFWGASTWAGHADHIHIAVTGEVGALMGAVELPQVPKIPPPGGAWLGGTAHAAMTWMRDIAQKWVEENTMAQMEGVMGPVSGDVAQWVREGMKAAGVGPEWFQPLVQRAMRESTGNPHAVQNPGVNDINMRTGNPAKGLMQTIPQTFNAFKLPGLNNIFDPVASVAAAIRYIMSRGGLPYLLRQNAIPGAGYARGGIFHARNGGTVARLGEGRHDEAVIPLPRGWQRNWGPGAEPPVTPAVGARAPGPLIGTVEVTEGVDADRIVRQLDFQLRARGIRAA